MREMVFYVEEQPEGGYVAHSVGACVVTEAPTLEELRVRVREAVACHCEECDQPRAVLLRFMKVEREESIDLEAAP